MADIYACQNCWHTPALSPARSICRRNLQTGRRRTSTQVSFESACL